eukprot:1324268-Amphidinium_carterae.1
MLRWFDVTLELSAMLCHCCCATQAIGFLYLSTSIDYLNDDQRGCLHACFLGEALSRGNCCAFLPLFGSWGSGLGHGNVHFEEREGGGEERATIPAF